MKQEVAKQTERVQKRVDSLSVSIPTYVKSEFSVDHPRYTSIKQKAAFELVEARKKVELTD